MKDELPAAHQKHNRHQEENQVIHSSSSPSFLNHYNNHNRLVVMMRISSTTHDYTIRRSSSWKVQSRMNPWLEQITQRSSSWSSRWYIFHAAKSLSEVQGSWASSLITIIVILMIPIIHFLSPSISFLLVSTLNHATVIDIISLRVFPTYISHSCFWREDR